MQKYLLTLLCISTFVYADQYKKIEKAIVDSNLEITRTLLDSPLSQKEYTQLLIFADSMIEKRRLDYHDFKYRFMSGKQILVAVAGYCCAVGAAACLGVRDNAHNYSRSNPDPVSAVSAVLFLAGGIWSTITLIRSVLSQATELEKLYNNSLTIKYLIIKKLDNVSLTDEPASKN